jgi:enoyl-CoA hydratase/carnithine racemase
MTEDLLYDAKEGAAFLTIHRESRRNAISQEMIVGFLDYLALREQAKRPFAPEPIWP